MPPVGFEPTISAGERPQTYALDRAATGTVSLQEVPRLNFNQVAAILTGVIHKFSRALEKNADIVP